MYYSVLCNLFLFFKKAKYLPITYGTLQEKQEAQT